MGEGRTKAGHVDRGQIIKCLVKQFQSLELVLMAVGKMECEGKLAEAAMWGDLKTA